MSLRLPFLLSALLLITGCTTSSVFVPYPARALGYQQALASGQLQPSLEQSQKQSSSRDALLVALEQGRLYQLAGNYPQSKQSFAAAIQKFDEIDERATISLSHTANQGAALVSNDNAIPYQGNLFERIFTHQFQALNYIALGDKEGAQVEMRRAQFYQDKNRDDHNDDKEQTLTPAALSEYQSRLATLDNLAQRVTSSSQNAYSFYLSGLLYESRQQYDDALIDYKRALTIAPDNTFLQQDIYRLADKLNRSDDLKKLAAAKVSPAKANEGSVAVLYEEGLVPAKKEIFLPFPWPESWYVLAFPYYDAPWQSPAPLSISTGSGKSAISTQVVTDSQALAARALKDNLVPMLVRQTLRAQTKHKLQQEANDKGGALLGVLVGAYNILSENADLRSWLTLPRFAHIARFNLPEGEHTLQLDGSEHVNINVQRNKITLVRIVKIDNHFYVASWPL